MTGEALRKRQEDAGFPGVPLLVMNGTDHRPIMAGPHRALKDVGLSEKPRIGP